MSGEDEAQESLAERIRNILEAWPDDLCVWQLRKPPELIEDCHEPNTDF